MALKYTERRRTIQEAAAYVVYMIVGSYYNKEVCRNQFTADRLYLYYKEQGAKKQEHMEAGIIAKAERALKPYEQVLAVMNCESRIYFRDGKYCIDFLTGFEHVHAEVDKAGRCEIRVEQPTSGVNQPTSGVV